jgi:S1-C subfamily serine protease
MDENDEQTMLVARSRLPSGSLDLRAGDEILAVGSPGHEVATETDLVDALRGRLDEVSLRVLRDGKEIQIEGRWPAAARVTERRGVWISGALIAEAEPLTNGLIAGSPALMVHDVSPGSEAESADLARYDLLVSADRTPVDSLPALLQRARAAEAAGRPLELLLLRLTSEDQNALFTHQRRRLTVEELEEVGP